MFLIHSVYPNQVLIQRIKSKLILNLNIYIKVNHKSNFSSNFELEALAYFEFPLNLNENLGIDSIRINRVRPVVLLVHTHWGSIYVSGEILGEVHAKETLLENIGPLWRRRILCNPSSGIM